MWWLFVSAELQYIVFSYECPLLGKSLTAPFTVSLMCVRTAWILFLKDSLSEPRCGHTWSAAEVSSENANSAIITSSWQPVLERRLSVLLEMPCIFFEAVLLRCVSRPCVKQRKGCFHLRILQGCHCGILDGGGGDNEYKNTLVSRDTVLLWRFISFRSYYGRYTRTC